MSDLQSKVQDILDTLNNLPIPSQLEVIKSLLNEIKNNPEVEQILKDKRSELSLILNTERNSILKGKTEDEMIEAFDVVGANSEEAKVLANGIVKQGDVDKMITALKEVDANSEEAKVLANGIVKQGDVDKMMEAFDVVGADSEAYKILEIAYYFKQTIQKITEVLK